MGPEGGVWTKEKLSNMHKADSVMRETMRVSFPFGNRGLLRKVLKEGVVTKDGIALKKGSIISYLASPAQIDPGKFTDPLKYDPFRFSRQQDSEQDQHTDTSTAETFVNTSPEYLPFGHGRHACPGRFLVDFELKMIIAYMLRHYDLDFPAEYNGQRPPNV